MRDVNRVTTWTAQGHDNFDVTSGEGFKTHKSFINGKDL